MPADSRPLFRPEIFRQRLNAVAIPELDHPARKKLADWARLLATPEVEKRKETELLPHFLGDIFENLLGYVGPPAQPYTLKREALVKVDGKFADAALGRFGGDGADSILVVIEGKGPQDPLDRPFAGRKRSAIEQALQYAVQLRIDWYLVTNLREIRLFHKGHDTFSFERFETARLATEETELRRLFFVLGAKRVLESPAPHLDTLLAESKTIGRELTNQFYAEYHRMRQGMFEALRRANPAHPPEKILTATQKMLDRVLFIAFCEDRGLLPKDILGRAYSHADPFHPRPIWENFLGLFRSVDRGNPALQINKYNGGLFAPDPFLESLTVPDAVCASFKKLGEYEYGATVSGDGKLIDVEILGHIFEQSISDLEELQKSVKGDAPESDAQGPSKRKKEGAFYTPDFVTRYIVGETLGPVLSDRWETYRERAEAKATAPVKKALAEPRSFELESLTKPQRAALVEFWQGWNEELQTISIVDPSCGSGAFLMEAFNQMVAAYHQAQGYLTQLQGPTLFDVSRSILTKNLFGVDLNAEAVEIARLSCWIKTAEPDRELTSLDANIQQGNSVVVDPEPLGGWRARFPEVFARGGFDVVIGNPPYVRQEWIKEDKPYLQKHYQAYDGVADLYVYFYELGLKVLKPGGRLGFIVTNKWMKAGYGEALRGLYAQSAWVEQVVDFGHAKQIFPDADVFPSILIVRKPTPKEPEPEEAKVCAIPREQLRVDDLSVQIREKGFGVPRVQLTEKPWSLEPNTILKIIEKLNKNSMNLKDFSKSIPLRGILTGFNEAFLISTDTMNKIIMEDKKSNEFFKPFLRGQDIGRWCPDWAGLWMIVMRSSNNSNYPWKGKSPEDSEKIFQQVYPGLFKHFSQYREQLNKRQDKGDNWWELRRCAYWENFEKNKIMYQEIQFHPSYMLDESGLMCNNKVFFLNSSSKFLLGVLNSPISWWYNWRYLPHMKDEALSPVSFKMESFPVPIVTEEASENITRFVDKIIYNNKNFSNIKLAFLDWLRLEYGIEKPSQRLQAVGELTPDGLVAEVRKLRGKSKPLSVLDLKRLKTEHETTLAPLSQLARETEDLERQVSDLVNQAYGLTPEEVKLMWATAPPRMPVSK